VATSAVTVRQTRELSEAPLALAVADASWYSTHNLFSEVDRLSVRTLLLRCLDYRNALQRGWPPWTWMRPLTETRGGLWQRDLVLPSGWMKSFPRVGMRPIGRAVEGWRKMHTPGSPLALVMTYPHYLYLRDQLRPDRVVYYNIDDYTQYWPRRAARVNELECQAVLESDLTVCVSRLRRDQLCAAVPGARARIRHLPHGAPTATIEPRPRHTPAAPPQDLGRLPRPYLGYVGTLEDRVDWSLLHQLSFAFPGASIVLIGAVGRRGRRAWQRERRRCLARPNIHVLGWKPQHALPAYIRAFDVNLIPYRVDHPFNEVCNPTKLMDSMGTGRPIVATALPECRLYEELIDVARSDDRFLAAVATILDKGSDDGRAEMRHAHAVENSCARVMERLLGWVDG
jgi:glycosyltransferase involved in cell wall biosynthesis